MDNSTEKSKSKIEQIHLAITAAAIKALIVLLIVYGINGSLSYTLNEITQNIISLTDISFDTSDSWNASWNAVTLR